MLTRKGFITNSSSTSFIFFGIDLDKEDLEAFANKLRQTPKYVDWRDYEMLRDYSEKSVYTKQKPPVGMHYEWESGGADVFANQSFMQLDESGVEDLPIEQLRAVTPSQEEDWKQIIKEFCTEWNLPYSDPRWQIAININA